MEDETMGGMPGETFDGEKSDGASRAAATGMPQTFDEWLAGQPEAVKALLDEHMRGLKSALESERQRAREFQKELRAAARQMEAGSEARKQIEEMAGRLAEIDRRAQFYDAAHLAGVTNLKLAYLAAREAGLIDDEKGCDFEKLRRAYPELFRRSAPAASAGAGTERVAPAADMNAFIRRAAGR